MFFFDHQLQLQCMRHHLHWWRSASTGPICQDQHRHSCWCPAKTDGLSSESLLALFSMGLYSFYEKQNYNGLLQLK